MIIDCHGHYTTAPKQLEDWRNLQIAGIGDAAVRPKSSDLRISDDELRESIEANQLRLTRERGLDLRIFSPRASFMAHHIGDFAVSPNGPRSATSCASGFRRCSRTTSSAPRCCRRARASIPGTASPNSSVA